MVDVEHDHLRRAARLAAGLDHAGGRVGRAHEGDRARGRAAAGEPLARGADAREVHAGAGAAFEDDALRLRYQSRIESIVSLTERMKHAEHCGFGSTPTLNQTGLLNDAFCWTSRWVSSSANVSASAGRREVALHLAPRADRAHDAADQLSHARSRCGVPSGPRKYFDATTLVASCDQRLRDLDVVLLEDDVALLAADDGAAPLPFDGRVRIDAGAREKAFELEATPRRLRRLDPDPLAASAPP